MNAGIGFDLTSEAKVLRIFEATTTDQHCTLRTPSLEVFIDLTQTISAALNSGTNC